MMYDAAKQSLSTEICRLMNVPAHMASADNQRSQTYQNVLDARKNSMRTPWRRLFVPLKIV